MGKRNKYKVRRDGTRETSRSYKNFGMTGFTGKLTAKKKSPDESGQERK